MELFKETDTATPEDLYISRETVEKINGAIEELPAKCKMAFKLVREDKLTYREAAEIMDISIGTLNAHIYKAVKTIRKNFPNKLSPMENFDDIDRIITNELSGEISFEEKQILREWLNANPAHEKLFKQISAYWESGTLFTGSRNDAEFLLQLTKKMTDKNRARQFKKMIFPVASVSIVFIVILSGIFLFPKFHVPKQLNQTVHRFDLDSSYLILFDGTRYIIQESCISREFYGCKDNLFVPNENNGSNKLIVARKSLKSIVLPDGTEVTVNSASWLEFPQKFNQQERRVKLSGEAYFDVAEEPERPFIIELQKREIVVLGTEFNVQSYENDITQITLFHGSVRVVLNDQREDITLTPGLQVSISDTVITQNLIDPQILTGWWQGKFYFDDTPLYRIAVDLSRWYGVDIEIEESCKNIRISGTIDRSEPIHNVLEIIQIVHPIRFDPTEEGAYFAKRKGI